MASFSQFGSDLYTGKRSSDIVGRRKTWYLIAVVAIVISLAVPWLRGGYQLGHRVHRRFRVHALRREEPRPELRDGDGPSRSSRGASRASRSSASTASACRPVSSPTVRPPRCRTRSRRRTAFRTTRSLRPYRGDLGCRRPRAQAIRGLVIFLALAAVFMALYFRTWKMSVSAMVALLHDLLITAGVYGIVGLEVTPARVIGFLTILGTRSTTRSWCSTRCVRTPARSRTGRSSSRSTWR